MEHFDRAKELKKFHDTKSGVKGLVDAGVVKVPRLFLRPAGEVTATKIQADLPTIDFQGLETASAELRGKIIGQVRDASETWGFFRIVNHGIPTGIMDAMLDGVRRFHEQPDEAKKDLYSTDPRKSVRFYGHGPVREFDAGCWKDILICTFHDQQHVDPETIPAVCRKEILEYFEWMIKMGDTMAKLLSEALGLSSDSISNLEYMNNQSMPFLYYPACPEPEKTIGAERHSDLSFLTLLLQDSLGGLQILHQDEWVNVPPVSGSLVVNIGDLLQIISNDKFKSVEHRVVAQSKGPRVSVASFFSPSITAALAPMQQILSVENPAIYREFTFHEFVQYFKTKGDHVFSALPRFRIN